MCQEELDWKIKYFTGCSIVKISLVSLSTLLKIHPCILKCTVLFNVNNNVFVAKCLKEKRETEAALAKEVELRREQSFSAFYNNQINVEESIFNMPGLNFLKFACTKIKFTFNPSEIVSFINKKILFYCTLRYRTKRWALKRDTFPINYKPEIYSLFYDDYVTDSQLIMIIVGIYDILKNWAKQEEDYKKLKLLRYHNGEDVYLFSEDEELFLTADEIKKRHDKIKKILKRMMPPSKR